MEHSPEVANYLANSNRYWRQALEKLNEGEIEKASEFAWGSVAEKVKALALKRTGIWLKSHQDIRNYIKGISSKLKDKELYRSFLEAQRLHVEFYESYLDLDDVREAMLDIQKLLNKLEFLLYK